MPVKKKKPTQKKKRLGRNPNLPEPVVVDTTHMASKEEQADNPLNRSKLTQNLIPDMDKDAPLPEGFKTADSMTEVDDLKFEMGRLREMLVSWLDRVTINGRWYTVMIDPMNRAIQVDLER